MAKKDVDKDGGVFLVVVIVIDCRANRKWVELELQNCCYRQTPLTSPHPMIRVPGQEVKDPGSWARLSGQLKFLMRKRWEFKFLQLFLLLLQSRVRLCVSLAGGLVGLTHSPTHQQSRRIRGLNFNDTPPQREQLSTKFMVLPVAH